MAKIIIFDLYDTVLKNISFNFDEGLYYLYDNFFSEACSKKELKDYAKTFLLLYDKRKETHKEICLIKDEVPYFFEKFGVKKPDDFMVLENRILNFIK